VQALAAYGGEGGLDHLRQCRSHLVRLAVLGGAVL
jgi:hypothetical protein